MKRLLCLIGQMNRGGAETFLMKIYRTLDRNLYQMDFCVNVYSLCDYDDEILLLGGKIFRIPAKSSNFFKYRNELKKIVHENNYESVLRITSNAVGFLDLKIAKKAGAKKCSCRSSNSSDEGNLIASLMHLGGRLLWSKYIDTMIAPSDLAAKYTFGKRNYLNGRVTILKNGLDFGQYSFDEQGRNAVRAEFNISPDTLVVGHVGRFNKQKNHRFLLEIFKEYCQNNPNSLLLLVGKGDLKSNIIEYSRQLDIDKKVVFAGIRTDIQNVLSAMDCFLFPSFYEGMPNAIIEAQVNGLPCIISDSITEEVRISNLVEFNSLSNPASDWSSMVQNAPKRIKGTPIKLDPSYEIHSVTNQFIDCVFL